MRPLYLALGLILLVTLKFAQADDAIFQRQPMPPEGQAGLLLVEERTDGKPGETVVAQTERTSDGKSYRITKSVTLEGPSPFVSAGGRLGVETADGMVEAGVEGFVFWFPPNDGAGGAAVGGYVNFAPIPGNWGRRFYLHGKIYRAFAFGHPTYDALSIGGALGYRQPLGGGEPGLPRYLFFEVGLEKAYLFKYDESLYLLDVLKAGVTW